jgi:colanic acid/amylovoran biosynthesis protein
MPEQQFAIIGATLWGNRGAEAMLVTTIGELRQRFPSARFVVYSYFPQDDRQRLTDDSIQVFSARPWALVVLHFTFALLCWIVGLVRLRWPAALLPEPVRQLRASTALFDVNGISYADGREKFLPFNIMMNWPAFLLKVPVIKLSQAMGPFDHPLNRLSSNLFLKRCRHAFARGQITAAHLQRLNFDTHKTSIAADIAFLYQPAYSLTQENQPAVDALAERLHACQQEKEQVIGLIPSSVVYAKSIKRGQDYLGGFLRLMSDLGPGYHFVFLPNATRQGLNTRRNNDLFVIDQLRTRARNDLPAGLNDAIDWVDFDLNTAGSRQLIARCDVLVTSRFHGMISGLSLGVPTAVIGWSHKYTEIMQEFNMADFAVDFTKPELADQMIRQLLADAPAIRVRLAEHLPAVEASTRRQFERVAELL